jgi:hypothetical protein
MLEFISPADLGRDGRGQRGYGQERRKCASPDHAAGVVDVGMPSPVSSRRGRTMVAISRLVKVLTLSCGLSAILDVAAADDMDGTQFGTTERCIVGHRFEPGPIVGGHSRQPTQAEFEARTREARSRRGVSPCFSTVGAFGSRPVLRLQIPSDDQPRSGCGPSPRVRGGRGLQKWRADRYSWDLAQCLPANLVQPWSGRLGRRSPEFTIGLGGGAT